MNVNPGGEDLAGEQNQERMQFRRQLCPPSLDEEKQLVRRMRAGHESAFDAFSAAYVPALHRFAGRRLGQDPDLTKEVVQTTLCRVLEKLDTWRGEAPLFTWLCACCLNEIAGHYRKASRRPRTVEMADGPGDDGTPADFPDTESASPEEALLRMETSERVHLALDRLPVAYARIMEWRYLEDLGVDEIAHRLDSTYKAAESLLSRARRAFRRAFDQLPAGSDRADTGPSAAGRGTRS